MSSLSDNRLHREDIPEVFKVEDVEKYRLNSELPHYWALRREFLLAHYDKFPLDRLIALSNCYINIEFLGSSYQDEVMKLITELKSVLRKSDEILADQQKNFEDNLPPQTSNNNYDSSNWRDRSFDSQLHEQHRYQQFESNQRKYPQQQEQGNYFNNARARGRARSRGFSSYTSNDNYNSQGHSDNNSSQGTSTTNSNYQQYQPRFQQRGYGPRTTRFQNHQQQQNNTYQPRSSFFQQNRGRFR